MRLSLLSLSLLSIMLSPQLYAEVVADDTEQPSPATQTLEPIMVSATRTPSSIAEIAGAVQSISREQIEQQAAAGRKIADVLSQLVPSLGGSSGTTSNYGQTMRGRQVQFMIDGIPQTGSRDISRQLNSISPASVERIEVLSGASSLYGSGATGGIINIVTKRNQGEALAFRTEVGVTAGRKFSSDALAYELGQSVSFARDQMDGFLGANITQRGAQLDMRGDRIAPEPAQTDRQDTQTLDVNGRLNIQLTDTQSLSLAGQYYQDEQDSDYAPDYGVNLAYLLNPALDPSLKAVKGLQLDQQPHTDRHSVSVTYRNQDLFGQTLTAEAYYRQENGRFSPFASYVGGTTRAQQFVMGLPIADADKIAVLRNAYAVLQSESEVDMLGLRTALQSDVNLLDRPVTLTYGVDVQQEKNSQFADGVDLRQFMASSGVQNPYTGKQYAFGPAVDLKTLGVFAQSSAQVTDDLTLKAGVRFEQIDSQSSAFTPATELVFADYLAGYAVAYPTANVAAGQVKHHATLLNLGAVYDLNADQQLFANFSQGFSLPDMQRTLRDVQPDFVVRSSTVDPIQVDSLEAGWRMQSADDLSASITAFYNRSDKVTQFQRDFSVSVADTDERIYGAEASVRLPLSAVWNVGGSVAYTRGQFKDTAGVWRELNAYRVTPLKGTLFSEWNDQNGHGVRVQMLAIGGSDRAYQDSLQASFDQNVRPTKAAEIKGYAVMDVLAHAALPKGQLNLGVYNVWNNEYRTVYSQEAVATYGKMSSIPAEGRTVALSYSIDY